MTGASDQIDELLLKITGLARQGVGGEQEAAVNMVRRRCEQLGLDFDDVMQATDERQYTLAVHLRSRDEFRVTQQTIFKFAITEKHPTLRGSYQGRFFIYTTTPSKHIETAHAVAVYLAAYRKEKRKFLDDLTMAFIRKHTLWADLPDDGEDKPRPEPTSESYRRAERQMAIGMAMDNVHLRKELGDGGSK